VKILYDHQIFELQRYGGISRYFAELVKRNQQATVSIKYSVNSYLLEDPRYRGALVDRDAELDRFMGGLRFRGKRRVQRYYECLIGKKPLNNVDISVKALDQGDFDLFHPTYYDRYFLDHIGSKPFIVTIHDMIHEKYPEMFALGDPTVEAKKAIAERAELVIAISENTKKDIVDIYGTDPGKIRVVYHGSKLTRGRPADMALPEKYILYMGTRDAYKNFRFFIDSIAELLRERRGLYLVCTGPRFTEGESALFERLGIGNSVIHHFALESDLFHLYKNAECFAFPSYYEGFGIPILEAFEAGCPALLARASCFPEIAEDAAIFFDPKDKGELLDSVVEILDHKSLREELALKGFGRLSHFSWDNTYKKTMECYMEALG
jgi:glycosyltransferase involved in cell wall biosynthesis